MGQFNRFLEVTVVVYSECCQAEPIMHHPSNTDVVGFLPDEEGQQLFEWARLAGKIGPLLEIGSYCGKSTIWLGRAAQEAGTVIYAIDHHRGSEEHQPGESYHDPELLDSAGRIDTFTAFRRNIEAAELEDCVIPVVANSGAFARFWAGALGMVFIDGGHSLNAALTDYRAWAPRIFPGGILAIHDILPDPSAGGQAPFAIWQLAEQSGLFAPIGNVGSLRGLKRIDFK